MCDYSLMSFPNRLAIDGEELVVHRFPCGTIGLVSPLGFEADRNSLAVRIRSVLSDLWGGPSQRKSERVMAVCVPPGTHLLLWNIPEHLRLEINTRGTEEVTFTQISSSPFRHRDAIRFRNGRVILLQRLEEGQRVRVLGISSNVADFAADLYERVGQWSPPRLPFPVAA